MTEALHFAETTLQEVSLVFMAAVYCTRLWWLTRFVAGKERQKPTGRGGTLDASKAIRFSMLNVAMPWVMESTRHKWMMYLQFVIFHVGVTMAILLSFVIPYVPALLETAILVQILQICIGAAFLVGVIRIVRRFTVKHVSAISTPDDHFSLWLLTVWFFFAFLAVPNDISGGEGVVMAYFWLTAFFLVYVPFSKISHYLYYPFTRYYLGKTMARRGVFPKPQA